MFHPIYFSTLDHVTIEQVCHNIHVLTLTLPLYLRNHFEDPNHVPMIMGWINHVMPNTLQQCYSHSLLTKGDVTSHLMY